MKFILGHKLGMSQLFDKNDKLTPVTLISVGPCYVLSRLSKDNRGSTMAESRQSRGLAKKSEPSGQKKNITGYDAIQIGMGKIEKKNKIKKTMKGKEYKYIKEFRGDIDISKYNVGDEINVSAFQEGDKIKISGVSKGKGFQGGVKRHGMHGRNATHGVKHEHRTIGSVGQRFPQHVRKGRKMPGRMGFERVTIKNLKIMKVDKENNLLVIKGAVPGTRRTLLEIRG